MRGRMQIPGSAFRLSPSLELFTSGPEIIFIPFSTTNRISNVNSVEQLSFPIAQSLFTASQKFKLFINL